MRRKLYLLNDDKALLDIDEIPLNFLKRPSALKLAFQQKNLQQSHIPQESSQEKNLKKFVASKTVTFKQAKKMKFDPPERRQPTL